MLSGFVMLLAWDSAERETLALSAMPESVSPATIVCVLAQFWLPEACSLVSMVSAPTFCGNKETSSAITTAASSAGRVHAKGEVSVRICRSCPILGLRARLRAVYLANSILQCLVEEVKRMSIPGRVRQVDSFPPSFMANTLVFACSRPKFWRRRSEICPGQYAYELSTQ